MKKIYICAPVKGDQNSPEVIKCNLALASFYSKFVYEQGHFPMCPHIYIEAISGLNEGKNPSDREKALELGLEMLLMCDELWVFGRRLGNESFGMKKEIEIAHNKMMPVRYRSEYLAL